MAQRSEITTVYTAGVIQGVALVTFPAAGAVFTSPQAYGLSSTEYGGMFVPQAVMAVAASLAGAALSKRLGAKRLYLLGLAANCLAMTLLVVSRFVMHDHSLAYGILLTATTAMGIGFGFTVPALNTLAAAFFPQTVDKAVLALNALLGLGTALAPVFIAIFVGLGVWWGLPVLVGVLLVGLFWFSFAQPLNPSPVAGAAKAGQAKAKMPARFWVFAAFALLYGVCETMNGNWAALYMSQYFHASTTLASLALTIFWATVTAGRILFAAIERWFPEPWVCRILPLVVMLAFVASAAVPKTEPVLGLLSFGLAGLGCSALLPLTISFAQKELTSMAASVAGALIACYQFGYGLAAFGVGPLQSLAGLSLNAIYGGTTVVALALAVLAYFVPRPEPKSSLKNSPAAVKS
jgi:MFS family permease